MSRMDCFRLIWELKCMFSHEVYSNHIGDPLQEALLLYDVINSHDFAYPGSDTLSNTDSAQSDDWVTEKEPFPLSTDPSDHYMLNLCCILAIEYFAEIENISNSHHLNDSLNLVRADYQKHLSQNSGLKDETTMIDHLNHWSDVLEQADFNIRNVGGIYCLLNGDDLSYIYHTIDRNIDVPNLSI